MSGWMRGIVLVVIAPTLAAGAPRTWTDNAGNTFKADLSGVKDGEVVLRTGRQRQYHPLSYFSLDDRDYIVATFKERKKPELIVELLTAAARAPRNAAAASSRPLPSGLPSALPSALNPAGSEDAGTSLYGVPIPSPELLELPPNREWTDLLDRKVSASFQKVEAPGRVVMRIERGFTRRLPLVAFVREDIEYILQIIQEDAQREVFPPGNFQPLSAEQTTAGYRTWTDRKGVQLNAKFVFQSGREVIMQVGSAQQRYPVHGLSAADIEWVEQDARRRAAEARARAAANRNSAAAASGRPGRAAPGAGYHPAAPAGGAPGTSPSFGPQYQFRCEHCGRQWTSNSPIDSCENCRNTFHFECDRCGHKWSRKDRGIDTCPKCNASTGQRTASTGDSSNAGASNAPAGPSSAYETGYKVGTYAGTAMLLLICAALVKRLVG